MSNWVENNPTRSIIIYTITLLAAAFATMIFVLDENKEKSFRAQKEYLSAQKENLSTQIQTLNERIKLLESENSKLTSENQKQQEWLQSIPGTAIYFEKRIKELTSQDSIYKLNLSLKVDGYHDVYLYESDFIPVGASFIDPNSGAVIGINSISSERKANGTIRLPGSNQIPVVNEGAGRAWTFDYKDHKYDLILREVIYIGDKYKVTVREKE